MLFIEKLQENIAFPMLPHWEGRFPGPWYGLIPEIADATILVILISNHVIQSGDGAQGQTSAKLSDTGKRETHA